jgi:hypothetical protein
MAEHRAKAYQHVASGETYLKEGKNKKWDNIVLHGNIEILYSNFRLNVLCHESNET